MTSNRWDRIKDLFEEVLAASEGGPRDALLSGAEPETAAEVRRLLALHERAESFLSNAPAEVEQFRHLNLHLKPGDVLNGRFEITRLLGQGGMGEVYESLDRELNQHVAVKIVSAGADSGRFTAEIQTARRVTHPNVCRIFDLGRQGELMFCTMELLEGETLSARLKRSPLPVTELIQVAGQICAGLAAAHDAGIIHRDLKPGNIMIGAGGRAVITDFGLAQAVQLGPTAQRHTGRNEVVGTLSYMAPEVLAGHPASTRSDIYSLGVLLYEAATGELPFESAGPLASIIRRAIEPARPPRSLNREIPAWLDRAILACMAPDAARRPGSAREAGEQLSGTREVGRRKVLVWGAASAAAVSLFGGGYRYLSRDAKGAKAVLLAACNNRTDVARLDGVRELLRGELMQSAQFEVVSEKQVGDLLERMRLPKDTSLNSDTARGVALRNGNTLVVYATVVELGSSFRLEMQLERPGSFSERRSWEETFKASGEQDLMGRVRDAANWVRRIAGEAPKDIDSMDRPPQEITTASWDALHRLEEARELRRKDLRNEAIVKLGQALEYDQEFPAALAELADLLVSQRRYIEGNQAWIRAIEASRLRRLQTRERYRIEAQYYDDIVDLEPAIAANRAWMASYPSDYAPHFYLGNIYLRLNQMEAATAQMKEADRLSPDNAAVKMNLVYHYVARGEFTQARAHLEELRKLAPAGAEEADGKLRFVAGKPLESVEIFQRMLGAAQGEARHTPALLVSCNLAELGRYAEARGLLADLMPEDAARDDKPRRAYKLIALSELARLEARMREAVQHANEAIEMDKGDTVQELAGVLAARCGDLKGAEGALKTLRDLPNLPRTRRRVDRLSGEIALARGRRAEGVALIERAARVTTLWDWNDSLAYALESTGKPEAALDKRIRLADAKGLLWISAERRLPGVWASNISALIRLAGELGRTDALQYWSEELHGLQKN